MEMERVDTQRAYELIREKIATLALSPGAQINEQHLAGELNMGLVPIQEALKLLAHEHLVDITPRHGIYVSDVNIPDLEQISELRLAMETLAASLAAKRATPDDLAVLEAIRHEQIAANIGDPRRLFDIDHKFHQAIAAAAHNRYLAQTLDHFFGLSQRFWYLLLPGGGAPSHLDALPASVQRHIDLVDAIRAGDAETAGRIMHSHVSSFYQAVREVLAAGQ